jgi:site-specific recombinase XerC
MVTESAQDLSAQNEILWCLLDATERWLQTKCEISCLQTHIERGVGAHQMPQLRDSLRALIVRLDQFQLNVLDEITTADVASDHKREMLRGKKRDITASLQASREWLEQALGAAQAHS